MDVQQPGVACRVGEDGYVEDIEFLMGDRIMLEGRDVTDGRKRMHIVTHREVLVGAGPWTLDVPDAWIDIEAASESGCAGVVFGLARMFLRCRVVSG